MASTNTSQALEVDGSAESAGPVVALSVPTPAPSPQNSSVRKKARRSLADRRAHRLAAITIPPSSPSPSELSTIKLEDLASLSNASELPVWSNGPNTKSPRILMGTTTFRWVKMKDGVWVKVKRYRIIFR